MTTRPYQYPQEITESTSSGPDFPGSAGDREKGRFRPSAIPRRTTVAVSGDDSRPIALTTDQLLAEILLTQRAILVALVASMEEEITVDEALNEASML